MTELATQPRQLAPLDVFVLSIGDERIGWTRDHHIGFTGFVDASTAAAAASVAHVALARRRDRDGNTAPAVSDAPVLTIARSSDGDGEWVWGGGEALARLIRPGTLTPAMEGIDVDDARHGWWSIEVELPALATELDVRSAAYVIHRGLRGSGLSWEALDGFRDRADVPSAQQPAPPARTERPVERAATNRAREWRRRLAFAWNHSAAGRALHF